MSSFNAMFVTVLVNVIVTTALLWFTKDEEKHGKAVFDSTMISTDTTTIALVSAVACSVAILFSHNFLGGDSDILSAKVSFDI